MQSWPHLCNLCASASRDRLLPARQAQQTRARTQQAPMRILVVARAYNAARLQQQQQQQQRLQQPNSMARPRTVCRRCTYKSSGKYTNMLAHAACQARQIIINGLLLQLLPSMLLPQQPQRQLVCNFLHSRGVQLSHRRSNCMRVFVRHTREALTRVDGKLMAAR